MIVEELSVVAAKISGGGARLQPSFHLPLRTKIELHFYGRWKRSQEPPGCSSWDNVAEEVSRFVYHTVTGIHHKRLCVMIIEVVSVFFPLRHVYAFGLSYENLGSDISNAVLARRAGGICP